MLVGCVRDHKVDENPKPAIMGGREERVEILKRAEHGIDILVVGHVVAEIIHG